MLTVSLASPSPFLRAALLRLATALLTASPEANPSFWMGKGREVLDTVWTATSEKTVLFAISLTGALAELGWAGWRAIGVPVLLRMSSKILMAKDGVEELQRRTIGLIAELWRTKKLGTGDGDVVWRNCIETWGVRKLREMAGRVPSLSWDQVCVLAFHTGLDIYESVQATVLTDILTLSSFFSQSSGVSGVLVALCDTLLAPADAQPTVAGPSHSWFVGTCMRALSQRSATEWESLELADWVRTCTAAGSKWAESADILESLAALLGARYELALSLLAMDPPLIIPAEVRPRSTSKRYTPPWRPVFSRIRALSGWALCVFSLLHNPPMLTRSSSDV